ncbi:pentapeptide repeat-containing protein, partial [Asticcacaulis sp.]|uniref:pentapeptide repeat-containing protein n=1 Tax=Asticcacaulis sp. TaxID=1872648 RepID=UPI00260C4859
MQPNIISTTGTVAARWGGGSRMLRYGGLIAWDCALRQGRMAGGRGAVGVGVSVLDPEIAILVNDVYDTNLKILYNRSLSCAPVSGGSRMSINSEQKQILPSTENCWFILANIHGFPHKNQEEIKKRNRITWNRFYSSTISNADKLILSEYFNLNELTPFSDKEMETVRALFMERAESLGLNLPDPKRRIDFRSCHFDKLVDFSGYIFPSSSFSGSKFGELAIFNSAAFVGKTYFRGSEFCEISQFLNCKHLKEVSFSGAKFCLDVSFKESRYNEDVNFSDCNFLGDADFSGVKVHGNYYFRNSKVFGDSNFASVIFSGGVSFTNAELKAPTSFKHCAFEKSPPKFAGAQLHEGTVWRDVIWPPPPLDAGQAAAFTDAYERLKLEMDRLRKHDDELNFFAKELECKKLLMSPLNGAAIVLYDYLCDYGRSYVKPIYWLCALILFGAIFISSLESGKEFWESLGISAANSLASLGIRKDLLGDSVLEMQPLTRIISGVQTIVGILLIFLIGLGLRNRFRMR